MGFIIMLSIHTIVVCVTETLPFPFFFNVFSFNTIQYNQNLLKKQNKKNKNSK